MTYRFNFFKEESPGSQGHGAR